jgi:hypothetical protein
MFSCARVISFSRKGATSLTLLLTVCTSHGSELNQKFLFVEDIQPVLEQYCYNCHGPKRPKGGVNLQQYKDYDEIARNPKLWETLFVQLRDRNMPPESKPQPTLEERDRLMEWAELVLEEAGSTAKDPGRVLIHRLSRLEYNNTVRDLFGVDIKPAEKFPADGGGGSGFDNIADTLFVPPILMERYLAAADEILDAARPERVFVARPHLLQSGRSAARKILEHFAPRAFRGPVEKEELQQLVSLYDTAAKAGSSFEDSVKLALKGVLVSPKFLFRIESDQSGEQPYRISDFELASRLSYFLWSSMPDDELFRLAAEKHLSDPAVLERQVRRMIADPKGRVFADNFASQWLRVRELATSAQPDPGKFKQYTPELRDAMMREPILFFDSLLREDASLLSLLDSDFSYVNEELASHYGIEGVQGKEFRRVKLPDHNRGGVLGMGAILTLTSYPLRTSPVLRGKWVLEEVLGTPPPPPPPLVKSLPQDERKRGGLTFRQQLERHRADPNCAGCHKRMDPLGLGLENFDAIGRWRTEVQGTAVDASGVLATGEEFSGPAELKKLLLQRQELFLRNLTAKMLSYALGRGLEYYDAPTVKHIAKAVAEKEYRSSVLLVEIVKSYPFQYRRNQPITLAEK